MFLCTISCQALYLYYMRSTCNTSRVPNEVYLLHYPKNTFSACAGPVSVTTVCVTTVCAIQRCHARPDGLPEGPVCCHLLPLTAFHSNVQAVSSRNSATDCLPALRSHARATTRAETWSPGPLCVAETHQSGAVIAGYMCATQLRMRPPHSAPRQRLQPVPVWQAPKRTAPWAANPAVLRAR
jgi:hypothetical protein